MKYPNVHVEFLEPHPWESWEAGYYFLPPNTNAGLASNWQGPYHTEDLALEAFERKAHES